MAEANGSDAAAAAAAAGTGEPAAAAAAAAAAGSEDPLAEEQRRREALTTPPYDEATLAAIRKFLKVYATGSSKVQFEAGGKLFSEDGGVIQLKQFVSPLEPEAQNLLLQLREEEVAKAQDMFETAYADLETAWDTYRTTGSMREVLVANQKVAEADAILSKARHSIRNFTRTDAPITRMILFSEPYEERKLAPLSQMADDEIILMSQFWFPPEQELGFYTAVEGAAEAEAGADAAAAIAPDELTYRKQLKDGRIARIFFDSDSEQNGFLSPAYSVEFTFRDIRYALPLQAYEHQRALELKRTTLAESLLKTRSAQTIRRMMLSEERQPADPKALWLEVLTSVYQQHPELMERLQATGTDALIYAAPAPSGVGVANDRDSKVMDPSRWSGENAVGIALETIRTRQRQGNLDEAPASTNLRGGAITEEEQKKAKIGAIINARRAWGS